MLHAIKNIDRLDYSVLDNLKKKQLPSITDFAKKSEI